LTLLLPVGTSPVTWLGSSGGGTCEGRDWSGYHRLSRKMDGAPLLLRLWEDRLCAAAMRRSLLLHCTESCFLYYTHHTKCTAPSPASYTHHTKCTGGANVNVKDAFGRSPLYLASQRGHKEVVATLVASGADVEAEANDGCTAFDFPRTEAIVANLNEGLERAPAIEG
jgi:ankyrin repeat protein